MALVQRCITGDSAAEKELYLKYVQAMYNTAIRMVGDPDDAKDIMQEVFINVFRDIRKYRGEANLGAWIRRITINCCVNHFRQKKALNVEDLKTSLYPEPSIDSGVSVNRVGEIHEAVKRLPPRARMVFCMHLMEGYTHDEIARMLSITSSTSKTQFKRAKELIQSMLKLQTNE